jgi:hypothetical protein
LKNTTTSFKKLNVEHEKEENWFLFLFG